jgi:N-dimethylarginine dimethylaminohydrolase
MSTYQSEYGELESMLMKHPGDAFINEHNVEAQWKELFYTSKPDMNKALDEYNAFLDIFSSRSIKIHKLDPDPRTGLDSIYVRDASIATDEGMIICNMGKSARMDEPDSQHLFYDSIGIPVRGMIEKEASIEGGDVAWIDESTLAIAWGYRTNKEGIDKVTEMLKESAEVIVVPSPHYKGPSDVFHLMSVFSPVDKNTAVVYSPLMSVPFRQELLRRDFELIEVPDKEFESLGCNVLAIAPRVCVMSQGNPITQARMEKAGVEVITYAGAEISLKGNGGPTCLTRPLERKN